MHACQPHRSSKSSVAVAILATLLSVTGLSACADESDPPVPATIAVDGLPSSHAAQGLVPGLVARVTDAAGQPVADVTLLLSVDAGGGQLALAEVVTGADGAVAIDWTMGLAPIENRLTVTAGELSESFNVVATVALADEPSPETFGDVNAFLEGLTRPGSTEDLAFESDDGLLIGIPGGIARVAPDGSAVEVPLTGDPIDHPLGIAIAPDGAWWVCDSGAGALLRVQGGVVETILTNDGTDDLVTPNHLAFDPNGKLVFTDPCLGRAYRLDPATKQIEATLQFDLVTQGGPNGVAFAPGDDGRLYLATESTALLCQHTDVELTAPIAGLFRTTPTADGLGTLEVVASGVGLFGDGLAFDVEGNLYVIFDTITDPTVGLALDESILFVLPRGGSKLSRFFGVKDMLLANVAFGRGGFGDKSLYVAMLAVPPFTAVEARGLMRIPVGVSGAPLH